MQVGIKLWSSNPVEYVEAAGFADFVEVLPVDAKSLKKFSRFSHKYTIHVPHEHFGFNPYLNFEKSLKLLRQAEKAAKMLKAELIVMHPGHTGEKTGEKNSSEAAKMAVKLAKTSAYGRLLIENNVPRGTFKEDMGKSFICYDYGQLKEILELSGAGFCLDLEHAAITAKQLGLSYQRHVSQLMRLKPEYFHLSGAKFSPKDKHLGHHLSLFEGDVDKDFARDVLRKAKKPVCLETPLDTGQRKKEVEFLKNE